MHARTRRAVCSSKRNPYRPSYRMPRKMRVGSSMNERLWRTRRTRTSRSDCPPNGSTRRPRSPRRERCGHRVDREVAAKEVLAKPGSFHRGKRTRRVVELRARGHDVDPLAVAVGDDRGPELLMRRCAAVQHLREGVGERDRIALHGDVDVEALLAEQDVANRASDEIDALCALAQSPDRVDDCAETSAREQLLRDARRRFRGR